MHPEVVKGALDPPHLIDARANCHPAAADDDDTRPRRRKDPRARVVGCAGHGTRVAVCVEKGLKLKALQITAVV